MISTMCLRSPAYRAIGLALALALPGCMGGGSGLDIGATGSTDTPATDAAAANAPAPENTAATDTPAAPAGASGDQIDVRRYIGPNYCPEIRVQPGTEVMRRYEAGHDGDAAFVISQVSVGKTARECLYDLQSNLTLRIGVSGRVVAGPKGGPGSVRVPLRLAIVRYQEATLASEAYPLDVVIPATGSTTFSEVHEITVPSPGKSRNYIVYAGLAETEEDLLEPGKKAALAAAEAAKKAEAAQRAAEAAAARPPPPPKRRRIIRRPAQPPAGSQPNVLPVPEGYGAQPG